MQILITIRCLQILLVFLQFMLNFCLFSMASFIILSCLINIIARESYQKYCDKRHDHPKFVSLPILSHTVRSQKTDSHKALSHQISQSLVRFWRTGLIFRLFTCHLSSFCLTKSRSSLSITCKSDRFVITLIFAVGQTQGIVHINLHTLCLHHRILS